MKTEKLPDGHEWLRIADVGWADPLDPSFAQRRGGRWNPADSYPTLYLNEDVVTARLNLRQFIADWPYEPEDLRDETGPCLVGATLPAGQVVMDAHTPEGLAAVALPGTYPLEADGALVPHSRCQPIGQAARSGGLRGVRSRSASAPDGAGRELAWFPATARSRARRTRTLSLHEWLWA